MKWRTAALERLAAGKLEEELDLFERVSQIHPLTFREMLWVSTMLAVAGYKALDSVTVAT